MQNHTLKPTTGRALKFRGELIGQAHTDMDRARGGSRWSGETGRETRLELYRTGRGMLISVQTNVTIWEGEKNRVRVSVWPSPEALIEGLGTSSLALDLYADADIDTAVTIE